MQPGYVTIQSTTGNKEWFNICFYNNIENDVINRSLLSQSVNYQVDDGPWESFEVPYNHYLTRHVVYGYQVTLADYQVVKEKNNFSYGNDSVYNSTPFTLYTQSEYVAYGDVFTNGLIDIEINEIDDMTAQELLGYIRSLQDEVNSLKNMLSTYATYSTVVNLYATKDYVQSQNYLTYQNLNGYATEKYVNNKLSSYATIAYMQSQNYLTEHQDLSSYATKDYVQSQNYLTEHQSLYGYATESYVLNKINSINPITYNISYETEEITGNLFNIQSGNGLYTDLADPTTYRMYIEGNSIKSEEGTGLYVDTSNIIDNDTIQIFEDDIPCRPYTGRFKVRTSNLEKANENRWGIMRPDNVTTYIDDLNPNDADLDDLRLMVNTQNLETVDDAANRDGIVKHNSEIAKTIRAVNGSLNVITANLEHADDSNDIYGIVKGDGKTINANSGILSVDTQELTHATNNSYGTVKVDNNTILSNNGIISINTSNLNYLTEHQSLDGYATESYVLDKVNAINPVTYEVSYNVNDIDLSYYATKSYVLDKVNAINPITYNVSYNVNDIDLSSYATQSYVLDKVNAITPITYNVSYNVNDIDLSSYATQSYVLDKVNAITPITYNVSYNVNDIDLSSYATQSYVLDKVNAITPITYNVSYNVNDIDLSSYATQSYVLDKVNAINLSNYPTYTYLNNKINGIKTYTYNISYIIDGETEINLSNYVTASYLSNVINSFNNEIFNNTILITNIHTDLLSPIDVKLLSIESSYVNDISNDDLKYWCTNNDFNIIHKYNIEPIHIYGRTGVTFINVNTIYIQNNTYYIFGLEHPWNNNSYISSYNVDEYINEEMEYYKQQNNPIRPSESIYLCNHNNDLISNHNTIVISPYSYYFTLENNNLYKYTIYNKGILVENSYITSVFTCNKSELNKQTIDEYLNNINNWWSSTDMQECISNNTANAKLYLNDSVINNIYDEDFCNECLMNIISTYNPEVINDNTIFEEYGSLLSFDMIKKDLIINNLNITFTSLPEYITNEQLNNEYDINLNIHNIVQATIEVNLNTQLYDNCINICSDLLFPQMEGTYEFDEFTEVTVDNHSTNGIFNIYINYDPSGINYNYDAIVRISAFGITLKSIRIYR